MTECGALIRDINVGRPCQAGRGLPPASSIANPYMRP